MELQRACIVGIDQIMNAYDLMAVDAPYFSVWYNKSDKFFQYNGSDPEKGRDFLRDNLQMLAETGDNCMYYLKIHPEFEKSYKRTGNEIGSLPFRLNAYGMGQIESPTGGRMVAGYTGNSEVMAAIDKIPGLLETKFTAMEKRLADLETEAANTGGDMVGRIAGLMENPHIGSMISGLFNAILPMITKGMQAAVPQQNAIQGAGIGNVPNHLTDDEYNEKLDSILDRLEKSCDLLVDL